MLPFSPHSKHVLKNIFHIAVATETPEGCHVGPPALRRFWFDFQSIQIKTEIAIMSVPKNCQSSTWHITKRRAKCSQRTRRIILLALLPRATSMSPSQKKRSISDKVPHFDPFGTDGFVTGSSDNHTPQSPYLHTHRQGKSLKLHKCDLIMPCNSLLNLGNCQCWVTFPE